MDGNNLSEKISYVIYCLLVINMLMNLQTTKTRKKNYSLHSIDIFIGKFNILSTGKSYVISSVFLFIHR